MPSPIFDIGNKIISPIRDLNLLKFQSAIHRSQLLASPERVDDFMRGFIRWSQGLRLGSPSRKDGRYVTALETKQCECGNNMLRTRIDIDERGGLEGIGSYWELIYIDDLLGQQANRGFLCFFNCFSDEVVTYWPQRTLEAGKWLDEAID